jgi:hypothetical protein
LELQGNWSKKAGFYGLNLHFWPRKCILGAIEMPRANRYFIPGYVWHITHRCHKREFLLKFGRDQRRWLQWLFEGSGGRGEGEGGVSVEWGDGHFHGRDCTAFRSGDFGDCHGNPERRKGGIILNILINVPLTVAADPSHR